MALRWSEDAKIDLARIHKFDMTRQISGSTTLKGDRKFIRETARKLHDGVTGDPAFVPGSRRDNDEKRWWPIERGFLLVYRATRSRVEILNVYHERELHPASR